MNNCILKFKSLIAFFVIISLTLSAQNQKSKRCGVKKPLIEYEFKNDVITNNKIDSIIVIPVHFIIVHKSSEAIGEGRNLSEDQIYSQIEVLNEDFRKLNPSSIETPTEFMSVAADCQIEFCLAKRRPDGTGFPPGEDGINRIIVSTFK